MLRGGVVVLLLGGVEVQGASSSVVRHFLRISPRPAFSVLSCSPAEAKTEKAEGEGNERRL